MIIWFTARTLKICLVLCAIVLVLTLSWSFLPHFLFAIAIVALLFGSMVIAVAKNSWAQAIRVKLPGAPVTRTKVKAAAAGRKERPRSARAEARARRRGDILHPDATVTLSDERGSAGIDDVFAKLNDELVGLVPVKKKVEEVASLLLVDRVRQRFGLEAPRPNLHMCFTGAPGTGKTTVALQMADLLRRLGYLERGHLVHAMRDDLVGQIGRAHV